MPIFFMAVTVCALMVSRVIAIRPKSLASSPEKSHTGALLEKVPPAGLQGPPAGGPWVGGDQYLRPYVAARAFSGCALL